MSLRLASFRDDETGELIPDMAESIKKMTDVDLTNANGQLRNTYEIYKDIGKVFNELDRNTQLKISEMLGGKRQANIVGAILKDVDGLERAYQLAQNSANSAMDEFDTYTQGVEYSIDRLKEQINGLYINMMSSDGLKSMAEGATSLIGTINSLVDTFGLLPLAVTSVVTGLTLFNAKFRESASMFNGMIPGVNSLVLKLNQLGNGFSKNIVSIQANIVKLKEKIIVDQLAGKSTTSLGMSLLGLNSKLLVAKAGLTSMKVAAVGLQAVLSGGMALVLSMVATKIMELGDNLIHAQEKLREFNEEFSSSFSNSVNGNSDADRLIKEYESISNKIKTLAPNTKELAQEEEKLASVQSQLLSIYPQLSTEIDNQTGKKRLNIDATKELISEEKELLKAEANKALSKNKIEDLDDVEKLTNAYKKQKDILSKLNSDKASGVKTGLATVGDNGLRNEMEIQKAIDQTAKNLKEKQASLNAVSEALKYVENDTIGLSGATELINSLLYDASEQMDNMAGSSENVAEEMAKAFGILDSQTEVISDLIDEFNKLGGAISRDTYDSIIKSGDMEVISLLYDQNTLVEKGNAMLERKLALKQSEADSIIQLANEQINGSNAIVDAVNSEAEAVVNSENNKVLASQQSVNARVNNEATVVNGNNKNYAIDGNNFALSVNDKARMISGLTPVVTSETANMINHMGGQYQTDVMNFQNAQNAKISMANQFSSNLASMFDTPLVNAMNSLGKTGGTAQKGYRKENDPMWQSLNNAKKELQAIDKIPVVSSGYNPVSVVGGNGSSNGGIDSGKKGGSGSSKEIADLDVKIDRYRDLSIAIEKVNKELELNDILSQNATDDQKKKYAQDEIVLLNKKRQAMEELRKEQEKERNELKNQLSNSGFAFDGYNVKNANDRLKQLESWANSGDKEARQDEVKRIQELLKMYDDLNNDKIPSLSNSIQNINNEIINAQKEIAEIIRKEFDEWKNAEEKKTNVLKDELKKRQDLMNKQYENEDFEDSLKDQESKINNLESDLANAMRTGDSELIASIRKQLEEERKVLNDIIRDREKELANEKFEEEYDRLDKELEDKINSMEEEMKDDKLLQNVAGGATSLNDIMKNVKTTAVDVNKTFLMASDSIDSWVDSLSNFSEEFNKINTDLSLTVNSTSKSIPNSVNNGRNIEIKPVFELNIHGGLEESLLPKVENMIEEASDEVIRKINDALNR